MSDDRDWQHPAEHAAAHSHGYIMNPPPLAKRLVVLTAAISLLTSFAVLFVAIPKGIDEYVETAEATTTVPLVKGALNSFFGTLSVGGTTSCAIEIIPKLWLVAADQTNNADSGIITSADGSKISVQLFRSSSIPYLVVAARDKSDFPDTTEFGTLGVSLSYLSQASVVDCMSQHAMSVQKSATQFADKSETPVYVSGDVHGTAVVLREDNTFMGIVCEHDDSEWFLRPQDLIALITRPK